MKPLRLNLLTPAVAALAACVSFDPAAPGGPEIAGSYSAIVITRISNVFEVLTDTFTATFTLGPTGAHGHFAGAYQMGNDSGSVAGEFLSREGRLLIMVLGDPPTPVAGAAFIRERYPWCEFPLLGLSPLMGQLTGDTLRFGAQGALPCDYDLGVLVRPHTDFSFAVTAVR